MKLESLTPAQISTRKRSGQSLKESTSLNRYKGTSHKSRVLTSKPKTSPEEINLKIVKPQPELSSSETESSSESESEYDEEIPVMDISEVCIIFRIECIKIIFLNFFFSCSNFCI